MKAGLRLPRLETEVIDRARPVSFRFDGSGVSGFAGDTISSALWANERRVIARSFKYHRPRADFAFDGSDPNALVQVGDEPNVRAGVLEVGEGLDARPQNVWPSLERDLLALNGVFHRFLPVGFYYKAFHTKTLWPYYERAIRRAAGLGRVYPSTPEGYYDKQYRFADVVVVGAGLAGLAAAEAASGRGARVLLLERENALGGALRYRPPDDDASRRGRQLLARVEGDPSIAALVGTTAFGLYDGLYLGAVHGGRLYKIRAGAVVVATGTFDRVPVFDHNDLPGVLTLSGASRLTRLYAVAPGRRVLVVSNADEGLRFAASLGELGIEASAADARVETDAGAAARESLAAAGVETFWEMRLRAARGRGRVRAAELAGPGGRRRVGCDALVLAAGDWPNHGLYCQAGGRIAYVDGRFVPDGEAPERVYCAGRLAGAAGPSDAERSGAEAGERAARRAGGSRPTPRRPVAPAVTDSGGGAKFRFVDFAEDVTEKDLDDAVEEGYDSIELMKRYTTISMGSDQGKYSGFASSLMTCERRARRSGSEPGPPALATSRPPVFPVKLGALAGRKLAPIRRSPAHAWHERRGCRWLNAGAWRRPDVYEGQDPVEAARAVRRGVGLVDVSTLGKVRIHGPDAVELLSRLYTNKWRQLEIGRVRYGVMCGEEGSILDDGVTARLGEHEYYTSLTTGHAATLPRVFRWWQERAWGLDVRFADLTAVRAGINVAGPRARELLERVVDDPAAVSAETFPFMGARELSIGGVPMLALRIGYTGELSYELHCPAGYGESLWEALIEAGEDLGVVPFGMETLEILRLEKGHVIVGKDTDSRSSPIEMDMEFALKLDKEYFLGKAGMLQKKAREAERGPLRRLVGFVMDDEDARVPDGAVIVERAGRPPRWSVTGWVTSCRFSPHRGRAIGLAWIEGRPVAPGDRLFVRFDGKVLEASVAATPFFDPEGGRQRA